MSAALITHKIKNGYKSATVVKTFEIEYLNDWDADTDIAVIENNDKRVLVGTNHGVLNKIVKVDAFLTTVRVVDYSGGKTKVLNSSTVTDLL